jgi:hypothetical protein
MENVRIRQHDRSPNLWWVSSQSGEDVAYITHPGKGYLAWTMGPAGADFVGKPFDSVDAALAAVARSLA